MKLNKIFLIILFLLCPVTLNAQARPATCEVRPLWVGGGVRSANLGSIGRFQTDGSEGQTIRSFNFDGEKLVGTEAKLVINVGIDYVFDYSPKSKTTPYQIRLAITASNKEEKDIFESVDSAEASTLYGKKWNLTVSKNINSYDRMYIFTLSCWDGIKSAKR